jgi:hypothetical protein
MMRIGPPAAPQGQPPSQPPPERAQVRTRREIPASGYIYGQMHIIGRYVAIAVLSMLLSTGVLMAREATNPRFHITETYFVRAPSAQGAVVHREQRPTNDATELWVGVSLITFAAGVVIAGRSW